MTERRITNDEHFLMWESEVASPEVEMLDLIDGFTQPRAEVIESSRTFDPAAAEVEPAGDDEWVADEPARAPMWLTVLVLVAVVAISWALTFGFIGLVLWAVRNANAAVLATVAGAVVGYVVTRWSIRRYRVRRAVLRAGARAWEMRGGAR